MVHTKAYAALLSTTAVTTLFLISHTAVYAATNGTSGNIETVVVTGTKNQATDIKKNSPVIVDIAPLEKIRSLPDSNAAEALQRLPGISMESDSGAGRFINIRGMDADLNGTTFDGVRMMANNPATPQGGGRAVAFDSFPAGILGGLEVIKSLTPEIDAEGLGGVVNIQPRTIPEGADHVFDASLGSGIESLRGTPVYKGDITAGKRFFDEKLSVIFTYSYSQDSRGIDDIEADYINDPTVVPAGTSAFLAKKAFDDVQYRQYQYHRTRQGYGGGITFAPDSTTELYLRAMHAGYGERANKHEFVLASLADNIQSVNSSTGAFTSNGIDAHYANINTKEKLGNELIEVGGSKLIADTVKVDSRVSWTEGHDKFLYSVNTKFYDTGAVNLIYNNTDPNHPTYTSLGGVNLADPANYTKAKGSNSPSKNTDTEYAGVMNLSFPLEFLDDQGLFKFGGSIRERTRSSQQYAADLNPVSQNLTDYVNGPDSYYHNNQYNLGPQPNYAKLLTIPQSRLAADPSTLEHDSENIYAGYAEYSATFGKFDVIGGVRIEATDGTYRANDVDQDGNLIGPHTTTHSYANIFPDLSLKYQASDDLQFRAAFSTAIARPGFNQITAARSINLQNAKPVVSQGNPDLNATTGHSVDLSASYFLPDSGIVSIGLFYKSFSDYIVSTENRSATNVPGFIGTPVDLISYSNIGSARTEGVELQYDQKLEFLPEPLDGFGFEGNLTVVDSNGEIRPGEKHTLPQTSPFNYNASVYYENGPVYLKLGASYVSTNLWAVGGDSSTDLYSRPRFRLDFGGTYDITDNVQAYLDIKNITNTHLVFTQTNNRNFPVQNEYYDSTICSASA